MTDDEPNSVSMEDAMQAIRDALGYQDNLKPQRELIPNLPRDDDFFVKRLACRRRKETQRCSHGATLSVNSVNHRLH